MISPFTVRIQRVRFRTDTATVASAIAIDTHGNVDSTVAILLGRGDGSFQPERTFAGLTGAGYPFSTVTAAEFIVAVEAEDRPDQKMPLVRLASAIEPEWLLDLFPDRIRKPRDASN